MFKASILSARCLSIPAHSEPGVGDDTDWQKEARRRVQLFREKGSATDEGDRILIMGEDIDGKRIADGAFEARLLAPLPRKPDGARAVRNHLSLRIQTVASRILRKRGAAKLRNTRVFRGSSACPTWSRLTGAGVSSNAAKIRVSVRAAKAAAA
jgi:hypothetical protein